MTEATKIITGATLILPHGQQREGTVLIEGNRISSISAEPPGALLLNTPDVEVISGEGCYLTPGLIELHFNGAYGCNLSQTTIKEAQGMFARLPAHGITGAVSTVVTAPITDMLAAIHTLDEVIHHQIPGQCRALGLHAEGPFLNPEFRGTHPIAHILPLGPQTLDDLKMLLSPNMKFVTLAPELDPDGHFIKAITAHGARASMGHSNATLAEARTGMRHGISSITHLYNAMRPFHHREPGLVGAAFCEDDLYVQIIGDGQHVAPEAVGMLLKSHRASQIVLTSDASPAAEMPEGSQVSFAGQTIVVEKQEALNEEGSLAGSSKLVTDCVRNLVHWNLLSFPEAVQLATLNPANYLGISDQGRIEQGALADLVLWDKQSLSIVGTFINGEQIHRRGAAPASH